jgi:FixJ family two-component response regulator
MIQPVVYVVDGCPNDSEDLRSLLSSGHWRVEYFRSGGEFLAHPELQLTSCLLLDLHVDDMSGFDVLDSLRQRRCVPPTIFVASAADVPSAVKAMQAGAIDLLERPVRRADLVIRVERALELARIQHEAHTRRTELELRWGRLTAGERSVARMICEGKSSREIGEALQLGRRTIENRRASIMAKLGAGSLAELVRIICGAGPDFPPPERDGVAIPK